MRLDGIHHVTCITGDAPRNVDYYTGTLGLRLVKKSVNQDDPTVYHLFYADEKGSPGADITFFEYPGAAPGRAGAGMIHTVVWRVGSEEAVDFWRNRAGSVPFTDPDGLQHDLVVANVPDEPLVADHPEIPRAFALQGFEGVRAFARDPGGNAAFLDALGFVDGETRGATRGGWIRYEQAPDASGIPGAGTVHHVAWASTMEEHEAWRKRVEEIGRAADARHRPLLVPLHLLPRAERRPVRDRDARSRVRRRRGPGAPRRGRSSCRPTSSTCARRSNRC